MCNIYTFYHICGHTYLRTVISCTKAVDRNVASKPVREPADNTASTIPPLQIPQSSRSTHLTPLSPLLPPPLSPSLRHLNACHVAPNDITIVPLLCKPCAELEQAGASITSRPKERATFNLVKSCSPHLHHRNRRNSEVASPDEADDILCVNDHFKQSLTLSDTSSSGEGSGSGTASFAVDSASTTPTEGSTLSPVLVARRRGSGDLKMRIASARGRVLASLGRVPLGADATTDAETFCATSAGRS